MIKNKNILTVAVILGFFVCNMCIAADSANDLLKMDVKRSSANDTVDVTFYTTGSGYNSVVTRKSDNRYVVLLPNTQGSSSIVPNLGGVKDLISDINVKSVDDGIGGYTKITFSTTKPVKIQTYTKKTEPLTKAQEEYKNLIAKQDSASAIRTNSSANNASANTKPVPNTSKTSSSTTPAVNKITQANTTKSENKTTKEQNKQNIKQTVSQAVSTPVKPVAASEKAETSKQSQVSVSDVKNDNIQTTENLEENVNNQKEVTKNTSNTNSTKQEKIKKAKTSKALKLPLLGALSVLGLFILTGIFNILASFAGKNSKNIQSVLEVPNTDESKINTEELQDIINDKSLSWQEKYKRYTNADKKDKKDQKDFTFVTDLSATKESLISDEDNQTEVKNLDALLKEQNVSIEDDIASRVSHMEHAFTQTPDLEQIELKDNSVKSEESVIAKKMSNIKLKTFAQSKSLREASRNLYNEFKQETKDGNYKEGRFVKLKNSPLSVSNRRIVNHSINNATNVIKADDTIGLNDVNKNFSYSDTSLGEYFTILDTEQKNEKTSSFSKFSRGSKIEDVLKTSAVWLSKAEDSKTEKSDFESMDGMKIQSRYTIDSEKSFYLVDMDGKSALIGRNGDNISLIKKFETMIYKPIQVRRDYDSVYIVRAGEFKCLVDVSKSKFGILLEI